MVLTYDQDGGAGELQYCCGTKITHNVSRMLLHMLLFVSQIEQYFFTEIEIEWCQLNKALQTKRFRAVQKAHQNYIFSITKKESVLYRKYKSARSFMSPATLEQI